MKNDSRRELLKTVGFLIVMFPVIVIVREQNLNIFMRFIVVFVVALAIYYMFFNQNRRKESD